MMPDITLKQMQEKKQQGQDAVKYYSELITDYVENSVFTGKELLDLIRSKTENDKFSAAFEKNPFTLFAGLLMEAIKEREIDGSQQNQS